MLARTFLCASVLRERRKNPFVDYRIFSLRADNAGFIQRYRIFNTESLIPLIDAQVIFN